MSPALCAGQPANLRRSFRHRVPRHPSPRNGHGLRNHDSRIGAGHIRILRLRPLAEFQVQFILKMANSKISYIEVSGNKLHTDRPTLIDTCYVCHLSFSIRSTGLQSDCHPEVNVYGFDVRGPTSFPILQMHYWNNVLSILRKRVGAEVIVTSVPPYVLVLFCT